MKRDLERVFEAGLFTARWLAAPIYVGLVFCLIIVVVVLVKYVLIVGRNLLSINIHDGVVAILSFIDLALIANLILIVLYTGYETFVSSLDIGDHPDRPAWLGKVDYSGLKQKLFASIVAITGIELLKTFMDIREAGAVNIQAMTWLLAIHVTFLITSVASALSEKLIHAKSSSETS
jgi:uncharacterized protein (TIGR00645 family)